ncbi:MAG: GPR endopeptidase [Clostridia bacterium]|nr:GPR endopeptidase [Clostridia bacterium]
MNCRTDIALERQEMLPKTDQNGIKVKRFEKEKAYITEVEILNEYGSKTLNKPIGRYITIDLPEFSHESELLDGRLTALTESIKNLMSGNVEKILVAGLGNENITPDALGPLCAKGIFSTRHLKDEIIKDLGVSSIKSVSAISTGVLGQTGIETAEYIKGIVNLINPDVVIIIDALASRRLSRLGKTVQLTDTGITPGSGVGNFRKAINKTTLGVPVISIGVPTVVDGNTIVNDLTGTANVNRVIDANNMMVTPREIDTIISRAASLLALSINCALQPQMKPEMFLALS